MRRHLALVLVLASIIPSLGASFRTTNFVVEAPTPQIAYQVAQAAEVFRKEKALEWVGYEMPTWPRPCPIQVKVTMSGAGGATSFDFRDGGVYHQEMVIEGSLDRLLHSVLPHEVTHTVFAHHFKNPVPRWCDEGGSVLSENDAERHRHDRLCRDILNAGRAMPLRRLFALTEYPRDVMVLYAQGFSVVDFLVSQSSRPAFINFVAHAMQSRNWDLAVQTHYRYRTVEELEQAWLQHLRDNRRPPTQLAANTSARPEAPRVLVRQTVPPVQPLGDAPAVVFRGVAPTPEQEGRTFGQPVAHPGYTPAAPAPQAWQPVPRPGPEGPPVRLGPPQFGPGPQGW
jgi:hypothetical protein